MKKENLQREEQEETHSRKDAAVMIITAFVGFVFLIIGLIAILGSMFL